MTITGPYQRWANDFVFYVMHEQRCLRECKTAEEAKQWAETTGREQIGKPEEPVVDKTEKGLFQ